jgi:NAD(P)-dependent dehydrogenase (short-subunit alcohol dehydrogenase family)
MRNVLVTGASSGIGEATVTHLAGLGMRVFAAVRHPADGEEVRALAQGAGSVVPVVLDVRDEATIARGLDEVREAVGGEGLTGLVNNAGEGIPGPLEMIDLAQLREQLEVNVVGQVAVTQAALPLLRQARGRIVFVGSIGGKVAVQFAGPYHASKYAIEAIGDCLRQELAPDGIAVAIVEPDRSPPASGTRRPSASTTCLLAHRKWTGTASGCEVSARACRARTRRGALRTRSRR